MISIMSATNYTRIGYQIPNFTYPGVAVDSLFEAVAAQATTAEQSGFDTVFVMDHFFQLPLIGPPEHEMFEAYTLLAGLAARTSTARLGTLVTGATYRHPSLLAKEVTALDVISRGRALLGIGAAWFQLEHESLGFRFPPIRERYELLRDALRICRSMFANERSTVEGTHFSVRDAFNVPRPVTEGGPPILIGGAGEQLTLRVVARFADRSNFGGNPEEFAHKCDVLRRHCEAVGRDYGEIEKTWSPEIFVRETDAEVRAIGGSTFGEPFDSWQAGNLVGTPEQVIDKIGRYHELGVTSVIPWNRDYPSTESLQLVAERVIPAFR
jgi:F420-dependent oxidoreductase-like protein